MNVPTAIPGDWNQRLTDLERSNRRLGGLVVLLVLMAAVQTAWHLLPGPPVVAAERYLLQRRGSVPVGEFSIWKDGTPAFRLNNDEGEARALMTLRRDGTLALRMTDASHQTRVEMSVDPEGLPRVSVFGRDGRSRANLVVDAEDRAELQFPKR